MLFGAAIDFFRQRRICLPQGWLRKRSVALLDASPAAAPVKGARNCPLSDREASCPKVGAIGLHTADRELLKRPPGKPSHQLRAAIAGDTLRNVFRRRLVQPSHPEPAGGRHEGLIRFRSDEGRPDCGNATGVGEVRLAGAAASVDDGTQYYVINSGDTLSAIAKQFYGDANKYQQTFEANREVIRDANLIFPGQKIRIPKA